MMVTFHRYILTDDAKGDHLVEIAVVDNTLYETTRRGRGEPRSTRTALASADAAARSLGKRSAGLVVAKASGERGAS